jgi:hypothetical protein
MDDAIRDENGYIVRYMTDEEWNAKWESRYGTDRPMTDEEQERILSGTSGFGKLH